jgi:hydroxymethylpyrimidine pyrophosphatase-like HAD family hydrolase
MSVAPLVLATDLDGTFAGGDRAGGQALQQAMAAHPAATLIYVTGRTVGSARELMAREALPLPNVLIADIGTSAMWGAGPSRIEAVEAEIAARWPGLTAVRAALSRVPGLEPQDIVAPRRASYWIADNRALRSGMRTRDDFEARPPDHPSLSESAEQVARSVAARATAALHPLEVDVLVSGNVYLDVLPRGVNKGWTVRRVLGELGLALATCVVAGDSLNDLALFQLGTPGIVVGNCEPLLREALTGAAHVYMARSHGAGGILEGLRHFRRLPRQLEQGHEHGK